MKGRWRTVAWVAAGVFGVLAVASYNPDRAAVEGIVSGIGWRYLQGVLLTMILFAVFAMGLNLEFGQTGLLNFGHVAFLGVGAYTAAILSWRLGPWAEAGPAQAVLAIIGIVMVATALAVTLALIVGIPSLRLREDYLAITTIGAAEILRITWLNEDALTRGPQGLASAMPGGTTLRALLDGPFEALARTGIDLDPYFAFLTLLAGSLLAGTYWTLERLRRSPWGRIVRAIREEEDVAAALGKDTFTVKLQSLALGGTIAALAGVVYGWYLSFITPATFLPLTTFYAWIIMVAGGVANNRGMLVGSMLLWGLFELARQLDFLSAIGIRDTTGPVQILFIGVLLVLLMLLRPTGVMGKEGHDG